jgi:hypothetical protein
MSSIAIRRAAPANPVIAAVNTAQVFSFLANSLIPVNIGAPGKLALEGRQFRVRAEGNAFTNGAYTVKASLLAGLVVPAVPFTVGNWTLLGAGTARAVANTWAPWWIQADLIFDSTGGAMQGTFQQMVNNLFDASAAIANQVTGINGTNLNVTQGATVVPPADPAVVFGVALTFGTADGANVGNLKNFEIGF